ncbi:MAG: T9SS type A sorting domain-containing protein [Bacteroidetes bacterium]|nr:T9SS type A sorting domain-containing protein [Bacteroidota bacterium]
MYFVYRLNNLLIYILLPLFVIKGDVYSQELQKYFNNHDIHQVFLQQNIYMQEFDIQNIYAGTKIFIDTTVQNHFVPNILLNSKRSNNRNSQTSTHVVDTVFIIKSNVTVRYIYSYNNIEIIEELSQQLVNNLWTNSGRVTKKYDANDHCVTNLIEQWINNQWVNNLHMSYTYDAKGNLLSQIWELWTNNQWINLVRFTNTYDGNNNMLTYSAEGWGNGQWNKDYRYSYTYTAKGFQSSQVYQQGTNNQWANVRQYTYSYNVNGYLLSYLHQKWSNSQWVKNNQATYTYDASGNQILEFYQQWNVNAWVNSARYTSTYDASGNLTTKLNEQWTGNQWASFFRYSYSYDINGNQTSFLFEERKNNQWVNSARQTYKFLLVSLLSEGTYEEWKDSVWIPSNGNFYASDNAGNYFSYNCHRINFIYKLIVTSVNQNNGLKLNQYFLNQNFPNPFNPSTTILFRVPERSDVRITIFNTLGQIISEILNETKEAGLHEHEFKASELSSGIYYYKIEAVSEQNPGRVFVDTKRMALIK